MPQARKHNSSAARQAAYRLRTEHARLAAFSAKGLPALPAVSSMAGTVRWKAAIQQATQALTTVRDEMQSYFDDRSEVWQESDRGLLHTERIASVEEVLDTLGEVSW